MAAVSTVVVSRSARVASVSAAVPAHPWRPWRTTAAPPNQTLPVTPVRGTQLPVQ